MAEPEASTATSGGRRLRNAFGGVLCAFTLLLIGVLAFSIRLFSVIKYESVIHEFDPYFNFRVTQFLSKNGIYEFWNWFDDRTWYPLGRVIGGTVYPGLTLTAGTIWWLLNSLNIPLTVETVCVFTAPIFSANASWATYLLTKEAKGTGAGLMAAAILAMVPSYISRSVAGSYDNEAVAIFALIFTFYLYVKTLNTGSLFYATLNALSYFYMVCSWGGYTFIINLIPMHVLLCIVTGRYSSRLYIAYAPLVILGTLLAALVPVVGFNAVMTSEHFASFLVFIILHVVALVYYIKGLLTPRLFKVAMTLVITVGLVGTIFTVVTIGLRTFGSGKLMVRWEHLLWPFSNWMAPWGEPFFFDANGSRWLLSIFRLNVLQKKVYRHFLSNKKGITFNMVCGYRWLDVCDEGLLMSRIKLKKIGL